MNSLSNCSDIFFFNFVHHFKKSADIFDFLGRISLIIVLNFEINGVNLK